MFSQGFSKNIVKLGCQSTIGLLTRKGHWIRGKPPGVARSLEQRLKQETVTDPELSKKIDIGFPSLKPSRSEQLKERLSHIKKQRSSAELEKTARSGTLLIDLDEVKREHQKNSGPYHLKVIAEHYGVFQDLFGDAYFNPRVPLDIKYKVSENAESPVCNGNILLPSEASAEPEVHFDATSDIITRKKTDEKSYWTLILTNPDAHLCPEGKEHVHWFKANIPNGDVKSGEELVSYLQPFPAKGLGYQRFIFILYKQNEKIDFSTYKIKSRTKLEERTFSTLDFYRKYQDVITPAGLAFFQSDWEKSLTDFYHNVLEIKEPIYEYEFPRPYIADQKWYPLRQPFNLYLDKYRDPRDVHKDYLERKLAKTHPFNGPEKPLKFPNAHPIKDVPSWLKTEKKKDRLGWGRINDI